ncbi:MAG: hypothetical protein HYY91_05240 [Candidatus Omnitrophica bacterium]|nr:hypothetical protein [Candidatus Omnitrophota bacterium]
MRRWLAAPLLIALTAWGVPPLGAQEPSPDEQRTQEQIQEAAKRPYANDLGPDEIDVSGYPPQMQRSYALFARRCSRCHTLARAVNSQWASPAFWEHYVRVMWHKPGSQINGSEARQLWEFLVHDSQVRKLDRREEFEAFRERLLEEFQQQYPDRYQELYAGLEEEAAKLW